MNRLLVPALPILVLLASTSRSGSPSVSSRAGSSATSASPSDCRSCIAFFRAVFDGAGDCPLRGLREPDVDESRTRDVGRLDARLVAQPPRDDLGDLAWRAAR